MWGKKQVYIQVYIALVGNKTGLHQVYMQGKQGDIMQEENKSEDLEIVEIVQTIVPQDTYFVFESNTGNYRGTLAYWLLAKVKSEAMPEPLLDEFPIVSDSELYVMSQQINLTYTVVHWSEIAECIKMGHVKVNDYSQKAINRILYRYNRDFDD